MKYPSYERKVKCQCGEEIGAHAIKLHLGRCLTASDEYKQTVFRLLERSHVRRVAWINVNGEMVGYRSWWVSILNGTTTEGQWQFTPGRYLSCQGQTFGLLTVVGKNEHGRAICQCDCGHITAVSNRALLNGTVRSCGCASKAHRQQTVMERYNTTHISRSSVFQEKAAKAVFDKYGTKCALQAECVQDKVAKTMKRKYGARYSMQNRDIALKAAKNTAYGHVCTHWKTGEEIVCRGSWEVAVVDYFNYNCINFVWQIAHTMPSGCVYIVDLYLPDRDLYVEIKGRFMDDAQEKWKWFHKNYTNSEIWRRNELLQLPGITCVKGKLVFAPGRLPRG